MAAAENLGTFRDTVRALLDIRTWVALDIDEDGRVLAAHDDLGSLQLVEIAPDGSTTALTNLPSRCQGRYVPGRRQVLVEHDSGGDEKWQISLLDLSVSREVPAGLDDLTPVVGDADHMNVLHDVTKTSLIYSTNRRNEVDMDIVVRDLDSGDETVVFDDGGYVALTSVSHDESSVAVTALSLQPHGTVISLAGSLAGPLGSGALTDPEEHAQHSVSGWALGDAGLVVASDHERDFRAVHHLALDGTFRVLVEADDHDLDVNLSRDGTSMVVCHHVDGLDTFAVHESDGAHRVDVDLPPVVPVSIRWAPDGSRFVLTAMTPTDPGSILSVDARTGAVTHLVDGRAVLPDDLRDRLVTPTVHRVPTPDGEQVPCFRYVGAATDAGVGGASVVVVHGGPEAEATRLFSPVQQALALTGFDVLVPNVRGSAGYGKRWVSLDDLELRLDSVADLGAIHDWLPTLGLDPARSSLWGGSYGGYMVLAGVAMQPQRWAAGVDIVGISSLVTFLENTSGYRRAYREREYGFLDRHRDFLVKASPITYLDDMVAPLFVIHGANDPRVPLSEAEQIKAALDSKGVDCELRVYHDEGHGLAKRANRLDAYPDAIAFLVKHLGR